MTIYKTAGSPASNQYGEFKVRYASSAQQKFIAKLLGERDHQLGALDPATVNAKHASDIINQLLQSPMKSGLVRQASDKQLAFIDKLVVDSFDRRDLLARFLSDWGVSNPRDLDVSKVSLLIDSLMAVQVAPPTVQVTVGAYRHGGVIYSVRKGRQSGNIHAFHFENGEWVYSGRVKYDIKPEERLSRQEALEWGVSTGVCVHCGITLTDPKSVARGMGPTCQKKYD